MIKIDTDFIDVTSQKAKASPRKRMNYNFHPMPSDTLQRMLHGMEPDTYVQPHKHENPDKVEAFFCLRGRVLVVEYDSEGTIIDHVILDWKSGNYGCEIPKRTWHNLICLEPDTVVYELKDGPYNEADDKNFAIWAPKEGEPGTQNFIEKVLKELNINVLKSKKQ